MTCIAPLGFLAASASLTWTCKIKCNFVTYFSFIRSVALVPTCASCLPTLPMSVTQISHMQITLLLWKELKPWFQSKLQNQKNIRKTESQEEKMTVLEPQTNVIWVLQLHNYFCTLHACSATVHVAVVIIKVHFVVIQ